MNEFSARISKVRDKPNIGGLRRQSDILAEYLACEYTVPEAAKAMGIKYNYANAMFQRIRKSVGERAI